MTTLKLGDRVAIDCTDQIHEAHIVRVNKTQVVARTTGTALTPNGVESRHMWPGMQWSRGRAVSGQGFGMLEPWTADTDRKVAALEQRKAMARRWENVRQQYERLAELARMAAEPLSRANDDIRNRRFSGLPDDKLELYAAAIEGATRVVDDFAGALKQALGEVGHG